jgi:hypothetical protein
MTSENKLKIQDRDVIDYQNLPNNLNIQVFRLCHRYCDDALYFHYDGDENPADLCAYAQFKTELDINCQLELSFPHVIEFLALSIGAIQIINFTCGHHTPIKVDLYDERDMRCGDWFNTEQSYFDERYSGFADKILRHIVQCSLCDSSAVRKVNEKPLCDGHKEII